MFAPPDGTGEPEAATAGADAVPDGLGVMVTEATGTVVDGLGAGADGLRGAGLDGTGLGETDPEGRGAGVWQGLVGLGDGVGLQHFFLWLEYW